MKLKILNRNKAQLSLEYILIFAAIIVITISYFNVLNKLYTKNKEILDNKYLKNISQELQKNIDLLNIQPVARKEIKLKNINIWILEKKDNYSFYLKNNNLEILIKSNCKIDLNKNITINKNNKIVLYKNKDLIKIYTN